MTQTATTRHDDSHGSDGAEATDKSRARKIPTLFKRDENFRPRFEPGSVEVERTDGPLGEQVWVVKNWADGRTVLSDGDHFSRGQVEFGGEMDEERRKRLRAGMMLGMDPPDHTRLRRMLTAEFTVKRIRSLEPRISEIVEEHLDRMEQHGPPVDLVSSFALAIPSLVICELLGVPYEDRHAFQARAARTIDFTLPMDERRAVADETREYMHDLVARHRRNPGDDLLGRLITNHGSGDNPDDLDDDELAGLGNLLLIAGHETTSNMLALGTLVLLRQPDQVAVIRDPERVDDAIEELLRYLSVVHMALPRAATSDLEIGSTRIRKGETLVVSLPAANRDPRLLSDGDELDLSREPVNHMAFGHGIHHCLGAPLARAEMQIAFPALFRRFPTLRLAEADDQVDYRQQTFIYGLRSLPVSWDGPTAGAAGSRQQDGERS